MKVCPHVRGVVFDPLAEGFVDICDSCKDECMAETEGNEGREDAHGFYLGSCGLIIDYLL
ncbi:hypothetical protein B5M42_002600 [Paenibacillus athensensis]|uniref:Uncharacterized protein n=1 Tax=Paenibacillus athensensis TaxID=1967502 RepID=A0A4Y8QAB0_9BACL|nr:hypothetical protein [Paenibacillus athensensis]MCD1257729.1 hypothetical protein [Paenibacillus athensensis]